MIYAWSIGTYMYMYIHIWMVALQLSFINASFDIQGERHKKGWLRDCGGGGYGMIYIYRHQDAYMHINIYIYMYVCMYVYG
jgi:hypothetical protein